MRSFRLYALSSIAAGLLAVAAVAPAQAGEVLDVSSTARFVKIPRPGGALPSNTQFGGLAETTVSVGLETSGVPCGNCVPASEPNIGLPWPVFAVSQGQTMSISTWFEATEYTGPCTGGILLKQGGTVVASGTLPFPGGCEAGFLYGIFFTVPAPTTTGYTTVIGMVAGGGTNKSGAETAVNIQ